MIFFKKRFNKVLSKARIQDGVHNLLYTIIDLEHRSYFGFSPPNTAARRHRKDRHMGKRWKDRKNRPIHRDLRCESFPLHSFFLTNVELAPCIQLVFTTTARMATCHDLMKNEADLKKVGELLTTINTSATPASLVLPWLPSRARRVRKQATTELYDILHTYIENRRLAEFTSDAIDLLITDGETTQDIVGASITLEVVVWYFCGLIRPF